MSVFTFNRSIGERIDRQKLSNLFQMADDNNNNNHNIKKLNGFDQIILLTHLQSI